MATDKGITFHWKWHVLAVVLAATPAVAAAAPHGDNSSDMVTIAARQIDHVIGRLEQERGAFPAMAVVIATPDSVPLMFVTGATRDGSNVPARSSSQFYIASQTKSFVGLLAARLDEKGILPLDTTLRQIWPDLRLPEPVNPDTITMRDLLTHQVPLKTDRLNFATAYVRDIPPDSFARLLATETAPREPGFSYANLGYLIYGAAVEARTGLSWRKWLRREVLRPLHLNHTTAKTSSSAQSSLVWSHQWTGAAWRAYQPKPDTLRHSAGGLVGTPDDLVRWIQANLQDSRRTGQMDSALEASHLKLAAAKLSDGELNCDGYALGWYICGYAGEPFLLSTGQFVGTESFTIIVPRQRAGMSLVASSDSSIQQLSLELIKAFIGLSLGNSDEQARLDRLMVDYPKRLARLSEKRAAAIDAVRSDPRWSGWSWRPTPSEIDRVAGRYVDPVLGTVVVSKRDGRLTLSMGALNARLEPAKPNVFAAWTNWSQEPEEVAYDPKTGTLSFRGWPMKHVPEIGDGVRKRPTPN